MNKDKNKPGERLDIALARIAEEKAKRIGRLDLGNLGLTSAPAGLSELDWLKALRLGGYDKHLTPTGLKASSRPWRSSHICASWISRAPSSGTFLP